MPARVNAPLDDDVAVMATTAPDVRSRPPTIARPHDADDLSTAASRNAASGATPAERTAGSRQATTVTTMPVVTATTIEVDVTTNDPGRSIAKDASSSRRPRPMP
jgi:hypothetical protein